MTDNQNETATEQVAQATEAFGAWSLMLDRLVQRYGAVAAHAGLFVLAELSLKRLPMQLRPTINEAAVEVARRFDSGRAEPVGEA